MSPFGSCQDCGHDLSQGHYLGLTIRFCENCGNGKPKLADPDPRDSQIDTLKAELKLAQAELDSWRNYAGQIAEINKQSIAVSIRLREDLDKIRGSQ